MSIHHIGIVIALAFTASSCRTNANSPQDTQVQEPTDASEPTATTAHQTAPLTGTTDEVAAAMQDACDWVTQETVEFAIRQATVIEPSRANDRWACRWYNPTAQLRVSFVRFKMRSVEAELLRIRGFGDEHLVTIAGRRGAVRRPGVWYGETPLHQYGMVVIDLRLADGADPDEGSFHATVEAVLRDAAAADPDVPG